MKETFLNHLLGPMDAGWWAAASLFAVIGIILNLSIQAQQTRNKYSPETPRKFSASFLIMDNLQRIVIAMMVTLMCVRFSAEVVGTEPTMYIAFLYGLLSDKLAGLLSKIQIQARKQ